MTKSSRSCLSWQRILLHEQVCNPDTLPSCSLNGWTFLPNLAPVEMVYNDIGFISMRHCYNKEIIYKTQILLNIRGYTLNVSAILV